MQGNKVTDRPACCFRCDDARLPRGIESGRGYSSLLLTMISTRDSGAVDTLRLEGMMGSVSCQVTQISWRSRGATLTPPPGGSCGAVPQFEYDEVGFSRQGFSKGYASMDVHRSVMPGTCGCAVPLSGYQFSASHKQSHKGAQLSHPA